MTPFSGPPETARGTEALEAALEILEGAGPEYAGGLANHGPMAAEALVSLARPEAVVPWVEAYRRALEPPPPAARPIDPARWREAAGDPGRAGDWTAFFGRRLDETPWPEVLSQWCGNFAPGVEAAAFHGVIRTGHAARALARLETPARRDELARGLAYWASRYEKLAEAPAGEPARGVRPSAAIARVEILPASRRGAGFITDRLQPVRELASSAGVPDLVDASGDASEFLSDHARTFARVYLENADRATRIALIHAVTGPSAVRMLLPWLDAATTRSLLRCAWRGAAAIYAASARDVPDRSERSAPADVEELAGRAVATRDEHGFKFVEACLRENAISPDPAFLAAALDATDRLGGGGPPS
jgi:hypothetical protein